MKGTHVGEDHGGMCPVGETLCWSIGREQGERSDGDNVKWTNDSPCSLTLFIIWWKERENLGVNLNLNKSNGRTVF